MRWLPCVLLVACGGKPIEGRRPPSDENILFASRPDGKECVLVPLGCRGAGGELTQACKLPRSSGAVYWLPSNEREPVARAKIGETDVYRAARCGGSLAVAGEVLTFATAGPSDAFEPSAPERHRIESQLAQKKPANWPEQIDVAGIWLRSIDGDTDGDRHEEKAVLLGLSTAHPLVVLFAGTGAPGDQLFEAGTEPLPPALPLGMFDVDGDRKPEVAFKAQKHVVLFEMGADKIEQTRVDL